MIVLLNDSSNRATDALAVESAPEWTALTALVELTDAVLRSDSKATALHALAAGLRQGFDCEYAAVASIRGERFHMECFTHLPSFDPAADHVRSLETACCSRCGDSNPTHGARIVDLGAQGQFAILPIHSTDGRCIACGMLKIGDPIRFATRHNSLDILGEQLGPVLETKLAALRKSSLQAGYEAVSRKFVANKRWWVSVLLIACIVGLLPLPYQVRCDAELQPVVRRHVAAPFDGVFQRSFAKPGDLVVAGQILGRLDPKELTWEIAAAAADRDRASKACDVNVAAGKTGAAQIDRLESKRLAERLKLLENRLAHLEIAAPIAGVVVSGNLERVEGAPVKMGQSLFEVAPLEQMVVEILVPEAEIDHVSKGQEIRLYLDAIPGDSLTGTVSRIYPRAELRHGSNVFLAEVVLDNAAGTLRPGMKATVDIRAARRPLIWIGMHRISEAFLRFIR